MAIEGQTQVTERPRENKVKSESLSSIEYVGLTRDRIHFIDGVIRRSGLPTDNIKKIMGPGTHPYNEQTGQMIFDHSASAIYLTNSSLRLNQTLFVGLFVHEMAHSTSPIIHGEFQNLNKKQKFHNGEERRKHIELYLLNITKQCATSGIYLDAYHQNRVLEHVSGRITLDQLIDETYAILVQLRYMNPNALRTAQNRLTYRYRAAAVNIMTPVGKTEAEGIDNVLCYVLGIPITNISELNAICERTRNNSKLH